jgi:hypothetical protein
MMGAKHLTPIRYTRTDGGLRKLGTEPAENAVRKRSNRISKTQ